MLGGVFDLGCELVSDAKRLTSICTKLGVAPPKPSENLWAAAGRIFFRTKNKKGEWVPASRSTWVWAKALRHGQHLGWTGADFATKLDAYEFQNGDKKTKWLAGLIAADTAEHGADPDIEKAVEMAAYNWAIQTIEYGRIDNAFSDFVGDDLKNGQMVSIVAAWDVQAQCWIITGVGATEHDKAWASISKATITAFNEHRNQQLLEEQQASIAANPPLDDDELLAALEAHNADLGAREGELDSTRRLTVHTQDEDSVVSETRDVFVPVDQGQDEAQPDAAAQ